MRDIIIDLQISNTWKIYLTIAINLISSINFEKELIMRSNSDNTKFTYCNDVNEVVDELFDLLRSRYQNNLEM